LGPYTGLVELYPAHIWKEDYLLFPMTNKILSDGDREALSQGFRQHESPIGLDVHHGFEQLAEKIVAKAHVEEDASRALPAA
jgi:hemerythrin-like domain-containing protein